MSYLNAMTQSFMEENYTKSLEKLQIEIKLFPKFQKRPSRHFVSIRKVKICYFVALNFNCPPLRYLFVDEKLSWDSLKKSRKKKSLKPQFLLLRGAITCYWRRTVDGGGEGAVAFCDFLPPCGSTRLSVKNGQVKFHNCHNERYIVNYSPCLTYYSGTGTDIDIYLPPVAKQQEARLWKTWTRCANVMQMWAISRKFFQVNIIGFPWIQSLLLDF